MRKFKSFIILISAIVIVLSLWGCQRSDLSGQGSLPGAVSSMFRDAIKTAADYTDSRLSSPNPPEGGDNLASAAGAQGANSVDMTGIPDVISTLTSDDGNRLVLVK